MTKEPTAEQIEAMREAAIRAVEMGEGGAQLEIKDRALRRALIRSTARELARAVLRERAWWKAAIVVTDTDGFAFCELCRRGSWGSDPQQVDHAKHCAVIRRGDDHAE